MRVLELENGESYQSGSFFDYTSLATVPYAQLRAGTVTVSLDRSGGEGKQIFVVLRDLSTGSLEEYVAGPLLVEPFHPVQTAAVSLSSQTVFDDSASISVDISGDVPSGSFVLLHSYNPANPADEPFQWLMTDSALVGSKFAVTAGSGQAVNVIYPENLKPGHKLVAVMLCAGELVAISDAVAILAAPGSIPQDSLAILDDAFELSATSATVLVNGCASYLDGQLIIAQYPTALPGQTFDPDATTTKKLFQATFAADGLLVCSFSQNLPLLPNHQLIAYLYKYDSDNDRQSYLYSSPVAVQASDQERFTPTAEITTPSIRVGDSSLWLITNFDNLVKSGFVTLYMYQGDSFDLANDDNIILYGAAANASKNPQRFSFNSSSLPLKQDWKIIAVLNLRLISDNSAPFVPIFSQPLSIEGLAGLAEPTIQINETEVTTGDVKLRLRSAFDTRADDASHRLYLYPAGDANDAQLIALGVARNSVETDAYFIAGTRLAVGDVIQAVIVVNTGGQVQTALSNSITVTAPPNWGMPTIAIDGEVLSAQSQTITVEGLYHEGYTQRADYYCNITLYQYPATVDDTVDEFWEQSVVQRIGSIQDQRGLVTVSLIEELQPGYKVIAKLRLPHLEWDGEEADYLSLPVRIASQGIEPPRPIVLLYNLGDDTAAGQELRLILTDLRIPFKTITPAMLNQSVGYLAEIPGFQPESGAAYPSSEVAFMLMSHLGEAKLDRLLLAMQTNDVAIDHKAIVTQVNRYWIFGDLIAEIEEEHATFMAILELDSLIQQAELLNPSDFPNAEWQEFVLVLQAAKDALASPDSELPEYRAAIDQLAAALQVLTGTGDGGDDGDGDDGDDSGGDDDDGDDGDGSGGDGDGDGDGGGDGSGGDDNGVDGNGSENQPGAGGGNANNGSNNGTGNGWNPGSGYVPSSSTGNSTAATTAAATVPSSDTSSGTGTASRGTGSSTAPQTVDESAANDRADSAALPESSTPLATTDNSGGFPFWLILIPILLAAGTISFFLLKKRRSSPRSL